MVTCKSCNGTKTVDRWLAVAGHYDGGDVFATECVDCCGTGLDADYVIGLAVANKLGRTMKPLGRDTGDVFVTDQNYRTGELMAFAASLLGEPDISEQA